MPLKPWYKVVTPREDLREGKPLDASEFAVHLDQVRDGRAPAVYQRLTLGPVHVRSCRRRANCGFQGRAATVAPKSGCCTRAASSTVAVAVRQSRAASERVSGVQAERGGHGLNCHPLFGRWGKRDSGGLGDLAENDERHFHQESKTAWAGGAGAKCVLARPHPERPPRRVASARWGCLDLEPPMSFGDQLTPPCSEGFRIGIGRGAGHLELTVAEAKLAEEPNVTVGRHNPTNVFEGHESIALMETCESSNRVCKLNSVGGALLTNQP